LRGLSNEVELDRRGGKEEEDKRGRKRKRIARREGMCCPEQVPTA
jgi:hypothetical protein